MMNMMSAGQPPALNVSDDLSEDLTRIGDMSRLFGVTLRALRFYEDKGLINPVRQGTTRLYTRRDKARLKLILLGRKVGFSLREVKQMLDLYDPKGTNAKQLRVALEKSERQLGRLERQRQTLEDAMNDLQDLIAEIRGGLDGRQRAAAGGR
jgi:DNA-binding transcriptional MerR regulator